MTSNEFVIWLRGFTTACNDYSPTPKQWDIIKETLDKVEDNIRPIGIISTTAGAPIVNYKTKNI